MGLLEQRNSSLHTSNLHNLHLLPSAQFFNGDICKILSHPIIDFFLSNQKNLHLAIVMIESPLKNIEDGLCHIINIPTGIFLLCHEILHDKNKKLS